MSSGCKTNVAWEFIENNPGRKGNVDQEVIENNPFSGELTFGLCKDHCDWMVLETNTRVVKVFLCGSLCMLRDKRCI
jgi:hypothetical protein